MTPWYTFVLLLGTNLDRMEQVMSVGFGRNEKTPSICWGKWPWWERRMYYYWISWF